MMKNLRLCWKEPVKMELNSPSIQNNCNYMKKHGVDLFQKSFKIVIMIIITICNINIKFSGWILKVLENNNFF